MLMIRLQRTGRKHIPSFRVVLTDKRNSTKSGKTLETLGFFNAQNDNERKMDTERVKYWLSKGAQLSGTLHNYLIEQKIIIGKKINVLPKKRPIKKEEKSLGGEASKSPELVPTEILTPTGTPVTPAA